MVAATDKENFTSFFNTIRQKKNNNNSNNNKKPTGINPNYTTAEMNDLLKPQIQLPINMCFLSMKYWIKAEDATM